MNFLDLFAGIGGFRLGMERAGHKCVGFVESDKYARKSYQAIHDTEGEFEGHDITAITDDIVRSIGSVDIICGGFPCQTFSIAGKRRGFEDTRGTLFFEIARFASILRPRIIFLENVKGLLSHNNGDTFETILGALDEIGYDVEWQVFNSKYFGVPQNRERVFIIGHLRGAGGRKIFPFGGNDSKVNSKQPGQIIIGTTKNADAKGSNYRHDTFSSDGIIGCLTATDYKQPKQIVVLAGNLPGSHEQNSRVYGTAGVSPTLTTMQGGGQEPKIIQKKRGYNKGGIHEISPTISANSWQENNLLQAGGFRIRKLTPRECWRLQGFPDWAFDRASEVNSNSQLYKQAGNSVTVNVIEAIANRLD
ncbi:TPA: DNA cytosine methyltransferase [Listeria monocytogenes]|uniref:DNA cytosine methyltransferase n=1 Tax=Listeria monocytogenes TaxID=1639 RepID=UPI000766779C|nr:DNA cytosine methyltransferase [Listeria monocytogenes]EAE2878223.1 DNA cytosine methyltransferase [Listeria monocytogenes]EAE2881179.1 DNA cytosine methyltransferase [Listeria monocytogenes]EAE2884105.1 DNA cytosine methyltransferase [Listeria monocytogenes]EAE3426501.1 DNA cytosine methyltransferase [Listeria monocytogenes]EAE4561973.1 DNA cytosine methyltransferase [Listeria monocytogenes]